MKIDDLDDYLYVVLKNNKEILLKWTYNTEKYVVSIPVL
jgi:hypothetical protein